MELLWLCWGGWHQENGQAVRLMYIGTNRHCGRQKARPSRNWLDVAVRPDMNKEPQEYEERKKKTYEDERVCTHPWTRMLTRKKKAASTTIITLHTINHQPLMNSFQHIGRVVDAHTDHLVCIRLRLEVQP